MGGNCWKGDEDMDLFIFQLLSLYFSFVVRPCFCWTSWPRVMPISRKLLLLRMLLRGSWTSLLKRGPVMEVSCYNFDSWHLDIIVWSYKEHVNPNNTSCLLVCPADQPAYCLCICLAWHKLHCWQTWLSCALGIEDYAVHVMTASVRTSAELC